MPLVENENSVDLTAARRTLEEVQPAFSLSEDEPVKDLLTVIVQELHRIDLDIDELYDQRFIETANGKELDRLGNNVGIQRKTGESDDKLRLRVRAGYATAVSRGTYEDIARVALLVLDAKPSQVSLDMARDTADPATALVRAEGTLINDSPFTITEMERLLGDAAVGGHRLIVQRSDVFTWDDSDLGWGTDWSKSI